MGTLFTIGEPLVVFSSEDLNATLAESSHFTKYLAGAELNVAVGAARLGFDSYYASAVGNDPMGDFITNEIKQNNVNTDFIKRDDLHTSGFYFKERVDHGDPQIFYYRANSAAAHYNPKNLARVNFDDIDVVHTSGIMAGISNAGYASVKYLLERAKNSETVSTFDPNLRPQLWESEYAMIKSMNELASMAEIVLPGSGEGKILVGTDNPEKIADFYLNQSTVTNHVVVKLGDQGAYYKNRRGQSNLIPGYKVNNVVDTVGAGDGFAVGLISGILDNTTFDEAVNRACAVGALAVQKAGDSNGYPTKEQLIKFIEENNGKDYAEIS